MKESMPKFEGTPPPVDAVQQDIIFPVEENKDFHTEHEESYLKESMQVDNKEDQTNFGNQELLEEFEKLLSEEEDPVARYALMEKISELRMNKYYGEAREDQNIDNPEIDKEDPSYDQYGRYSEIKKQQREALAKAAQQAQKSKYKSRKHHLGEGYNPYL